MITFPGQRTLEQNNKIWGLVQRLSTYAHLDGEEVMRDLCIEVSGQPSSKALSREQADRVIEELEARVKKSRQDALSKKEGDSVDPDAFHTQDQMNMMLCLFADLGWTSNAQQQGFYRRILAHKRQGKAIFPHTRGEMRKITEALKAIYMRKHSAQELQEKVRRLLSPTPYSLPPTQGPGTGCHPELSEAAPEADSPGRKPHQPVILSGAKNLGLTEWETKFLRNLQEKLLLGRKLTPAMIKKLDEIYSKNYSREKE